MFSESCSNKRDIGIVAHIDAGKTTLTERILYASGVISVCGEVHEGTTVTDFMRQERERGISIVSAAATCQWRDVAINLIDTPGHVDFTAEVERSLRVMDGVVAVFCAVHGVQAQSETVLKRVCKYGLPIVAFINKMDREGADCGRVIEQLAKVVPAKPMPMQVPVFDGHRFCGLVDAFTGRTIWGEIPEQAADETELELDDLRGRWVETLAEDDEEIMECFLSGAFPDTGLMRRALRRAVVSGHVIPVFLGSALNHTGVSEVLDGVVDFLPSPEDRLRSPWFRSQLSVFGGSLNVDGNPGICVQVFRTAHDWQGNTAAIRVFSGRLKRGTPMHDVNRSGDFTVDRIFRPLAAELTEVDSAEEGDIVVITGEGMNVRTGDTLCGPGLKVRLARMRFPEPVMSQMVEAVGEEARQKMAAALAAFAEEDPTLRVKRDSDAGRALLSGMGELHLEVVRERLNAEFGVPTRAGRPMVAYKATVVTSADDHHIVF